MKVASYKADGTSNGERALPETPFDGIVNEGVLHQVVTAVLASRRQGTAATRNRAAARGGGRKPWRQKGTGRARAGTIRSPLWRGGAVVFGPQPRSYAPKVPKKIRRLAVRSALNARALEDGLALVEPIEIDAPKTRAIVDMLEEIGRASENVLVLTAGSKPKVHLSARNIPGVRVLPWGEVSAYHVLWADFVLVESTALERTVGTEPSADVEDEAALDTGGEAALDTEGEE